ncbi:hypothetical protein PF005_g7561 [Phytophthora fragariae]|uniref:Uncharacterized protein n=1 Tax=Phytophthora fragariae TaxID=53985 RepID=A0A6A3F9F9_9STRA|nr:hypothetical protein PF003_g7111 [Phytophthora fragariae]KAE8942465.1 hypothetical protein PF009_g7759 [Phytophthora fragariae]KAE9004165.1 hypothetical protein PF011_g12582 [Phytophthora fragariae]KAE9122706.1 hypothetical protein PF007_g7334 [Phytophthora fragariae]KAE9123706.1 hypothetical protein PF010_g6289 [Phytophthora fragariae]
MLSLLSKLVASFHLHYLYLTTFMQFNSTRIHLQNNLPLSASNIIYSRPYEYSNEVARGTKKL